MKRRKCYCTGGCREGALLKIRTILVGLCAQIRFADIRVSLFMTFARILSGRCRGQPTPVIDNVTGTIFLAFNDGCNPKSKGVVQGGWFVRFSSFLNSSPSFRNILSSPCRPLSAATRARLINHAKHVKHVRISQALP